MGAYEWTVNDAVDAIEDAAGVIENGLSKLRKAIVRIKKIKPASDADQKKLDILIVASELYGDSIDKAMDAMGAKVVEVIGN